MDALARNNVTVRGRADGPPLMFSHGFGCDQGMWRYVTPDFESTHRVVCFDHVGAGDSDLSAYDSGRYATLDGYAADVVQVLEALAGPPITFVGHSVSAMIGLLAAIARPDLIGRLVMVAPNPRYIDDTGYRGGFSRAEIDELLETMEDNYLGWAEQIAPVIMGAPDRPDLGGELARSFCRTDPVIAREFATTTFLSDNRADLSDLPVPALVLQCTDDALAPRAVGDYVHAHLPDSELVLLAATGHCPNMSAPVELVAAMRAHLGSA